MKKTTGSKKTSSQRSRSTTDPGCGRVDPEQEARWEQHKKDCLSRFKEMREADKLAQSLVKMRSLEDRRAELARIAHHRGSDFAGFVKQFMLGHWASRGDATSRAKKG